MADMLRSFAHVQNLDLAQSMVSDDGIKSVLEMPLLRGITLGPNMTDKTMEILAASKTLEVVNCSHSQVGDKGVVAMQKSATLQAIYLTGRPITRTAMEALAQYPKLRDLRVAKCSYLQEEDAETVFEMKHLRRLSIAISSEQREAFNRRLPDLDLFP